MTSTTGASPAPARAERRRPTASPQVVRLPTIGRPSTSGISTSTTHGPAAAAAEPGTAPTDIWAGSTPSRPDGLVPGPDTRPGKTQHPAGASSPTRRGVPRFERISSPQEPPPRCIRTAAGLVSALGSSSSSSPTNLVGSVRAWQRLQPPGAAPSVRDHEEPVGGARITVPSRSERHTVSFLR